MDAVLRPPLSPAPTPRRTVAVLAVTAAAFGLILVSQRGPAGRVIPPALSVQAQSAAVLPQLSSTVSQPPAVGTPVQQAVSLIDRAMAFIEPFEDRCDRAYRDPRGYLTIGVGFNLDRPGAAEDVNKLLPGVGYRALRRGDIALTDAQIDLLLRHDTRRAIDTARRQVTGFDSLPLDAQLIVIDMTFNTGSLHKWRKLRWALARRDYAAAADAMHRSRWRRQTGQRARNLIELMHGLAQG